MLGYDQRAEKRGLNGTHLFVDRPHSPCVEPNRPMEPPEGGWREANPSPKERREVPDIGVAGRARHFLDGELPFQEQPGRDVEPDGDEVLGDGSPGPLTKETVGVTLAHADLR